MCGIAGIVDPGLDLDPATVRVERMLRVQAHRGPDERDVVAEPGVVLGTARLAIIDAEGSKQPMRSSDGRYTLSFNGEVLNYRELRSHPRIRDWDFASSGDTEVVLALLARLGAPALDFFNGQFAGALWDAERRRLLLFRDRFGILPLYFAQTADGFAFASTIRALLGLDGVDPSLDPRALGDLFCLWAPHPPRTICAGVRQLPAASYLEVGDRPGQPRRYWEPRFADPGVARVDGAAEQLLAALRGAVARGLRADEPVGTLISGGIDSATVAALAATDGRPGFSVAFENGEHDESAHQATVAAAVGSSHHTVRCSAGDLAAALPAAVAHAEAPLLRFAPCSSYLLGELVHEAGVKAVVSGEGADELLAGYDLFHQVLARAGAGSRRARLQAAGAQGTPAESLPPRVASMLMEGPLESAFPAQQLRWNAARQLRAYVEPELLEELGDPVAELHADLPEEFGGWSPLARAQYVEMRTLLPDYILSAQGERMLMAHSVEARIPFLDNEVVDVALRLGEEDKVFGASEKDVLRRAVAGIVPDSIRLRPKQAYRAPVAATLRSPTGEELTDLLGPDGDDGVFVRRKVERLATRLRAGKEISGTQEMALAGVLTTRLWMQIVAGWRREREELYA